MNDLRKMAAAIIFGTLLSTAGAVGMVNIVVDINSSQGVCIQNAAAIYGDEGDCTGMIRCIAGNKVAVIVVAGPDSDVATNHVDAIGAKFK